MYFKKHKPRKFIGFPIFRTQHPLRMSDHEEQFENAISGESLTYPLQCSALRKNGHVMIKGNPCKIVEMTTSKTGKHGHAKASGCFTEI